MEPTLIVIGLDHHSAPVAVRERFWIGEKRRYDALRELRQAEGIDEAVVLSTCNRTEFLLWAAEPTLAANSLLHFLTVQYGLKLCEWEHFHRLLDDAALAHIFRVSSGLSCQALCEPEVTSEIQAAWQQARTVRASGHFLDSILEKALAVSQEVQSRTALGAFSVSVPQATVELAERLFGSLEGRRALLLGGATVNELVGHALADKGVTSFCVISQTLEESRKLAQTLGGVSAPLKDRWQHILAADIVVSCSGCPHVILTRTEAERIGAERHRAPLAIFDIGMPRDVDPDVHRVDGILLYDLDGLERFVKHSGAERHQAAADAEKIIIREAREFRAKLQAESVVPTMIALRRHLEDIGRQELESFNQERGPFTREQHQALHALTTQVIQKIASSLGRELKGLSEKGEQEQMTAVLQRLFRLDSPSTALAGTRSEKNNYEQCKERTVALPH
ncbi:MAG TPA: glutamyl-tRNA reductase [Candidatus Sulfotelmatobacter sp.]|nr:glutamyl-tRNA reductase [Candidatus Sulfotelmatobacter sp.]